METQTLIEIVRRAQKGDSRAQQELYVDGSKSVYFNALKILRSKEDAEDITQDVFITVFEKLPELKNPAAYYKWVNQITANKCMSFLRKHKPIPTDDVILDILELEDDDGETPEKLLDDEATRRIIMEIIDALPDSQRVCVMYRYFNQLSIEEIAALTETNEHTVKSRLALARNKIRAAILEKEEKDGIRLHVLIPIMPVLMKALDEFTIPDGVQARMWDNIQKNLAAKGQANGNAGTDNMINANGAVKTVGKVAAKVISKKVVIAVISVIGAAAVIIAGVIFLPQLFNAPDSTPPPGVTDNESTQSGTETTTPTQATPQSSDSITDFQYSISDNQVMITKYIGSATTVVIPATIEGKPVTNIGNQAFYGCASFSITIPDSVTNIGEQAFSNCSNLTDITIPNGVTSISREAFASCANLTGVTIPDSVTSIGEQAFVFCHGLTSVNIPNSVTSIGDGAFYACIGLTDVTIPNSLTSISRYTFFSCSSLTGVTIPNSITSIGEEAFYECTSLTSITIPNSVTSIGEEVFSGCTSLTDITIPGSVTSINKETFYGCTNLISVTILNGVTNIGVDAFRACVSLTSVTIPNSVTSIGDRVFYECASLTSITIPNSVTSIGSGLFHSCTSLQAIYFEGSAPAAGSYVYSGVASGFTIYHHANTAGWTNSPWNEYPLVAY